MKLSESLTLDALLIQVYRNVQALLLLSWVNPKLQYSLLAAGLSPWDYNLRYLWKLQLILIHLKFLLSLLSLLQLLGILKHQSARFPNKVSNWIFYPIYIAMNASKLVDNTLPPLNGTSVALLQGSPRWSIHGIAAFCIILITICILIAWMSLILLMCNITWITLKADVKNIVLYVFLGD